MLFACFLGGIFISGLLGAGKNQGLAGGAIVVGYGVISSIIGFISSFIIASVVNIKTIIKANWILLISISITVGYTYYKFSIRDKVQKEENEKYKPTPTAPIQKKMSLVTFSAYEGPISIQKNESLTLGIGFFKPNFYEYPTLYFFGGVNLEKGLTDHSPMDSVVFTKDKYNNPSTSYAPPWLYPEYLKLDYGIIIFKVLGVGFDFLKVESNRQTGQITYLDKSKGTFTTWEEFLLLVHSVEFNENSLKKVFIKPLDYAGEEKIDFEFMQPLLVEQDWMYVKLVDNDLKEKGKGWIRWKINNELLITYSLLS